jgi:hypothetical protein
MIGYRDEKGNVNARSGQRTRRGQDGKSRLFPASNEELRQEESHPRVAEWVGTENATSVLRLLLHGRRGHAHEYGTEEFAGGTEFPIELGEAGAGAGVATVEQGISEGKRHATLGVASGVGPSGAVAVARPEVDVGELRLGVLELWTLLHSCLVEQLQVFGIDDLRRAVDEQKAVVGVGAKRIDDEGDIDRWADRVKTAHDADVSTALLLERAGEGDCRG